MKISAALSQSLRPKDGVVMEKASGESSPVRKKLRLSWNQRPKSRDPRLLRWFTDKGTGAETWERKIKSPNPRYSPVTITPTQLLAPWNHILSRLFEKDSQISGVGDHAQSLSQSHPDAWRTCGIWRAGLRRTYLLVHRSLTATQTGYTWDVLSRHTLVITSDEEFDNDVRNTPPSHVYLHVPGRIPTIDHGGPSTLQRCCTTCRTASQSL